MLRVLLFHKGEKLPSRCFRRRAMPRKGVGEIFDIELKGSFSVSRLGHFDQWRSCEGLQAWMLSAIWLLFHYQGGAYGRWRLG